MLGIFSKERRVHRGARLDRRSSAIRDSGLFDCNWYAENFGVDGNDLSIIEHYLTNSFADPRFQPHPLFDSEYYRNIANLTPNFEESDIEHYLVKGCKEGFSPTPAFDRTWYRSQVGNLRRHDDEFRHFLHVGAGKGYSPHPMFDVAYYIKQDQQLTTNSTNALTHYIACGAANGLNPNPFFHGAWYRRSYGMLMPERANPFIHFITVGIDEGMEPHPEINLDHLIDSIGLPKGARREAFTNLIQGNIKSTLREKIEYKVKTYSAIQNSYIWGRERELDKPISISSILHDITPRPAIPDLADRDPIIEPKEFDLLTVDIWDTVLRRDCAPDEIKVQSARYLLFSAFYDIRPMYRNLLTLFKCRIQSENASANNDEFEYRLEEAIDLLLGTVLQPGISDCKISGYRSGLIAHELAAETRATRLDPLMRKYLEENRQPAVFISDFYTSANFLESLLGAHDASKWFRRGYSSSDTYETKRSGQLFDKVVAESGLKPSQIFHIGDNAHADVKMAKAKGLATHHFVQAGEDLRTKWFIQGFEAWRLGKVDVHHGRIAALCESIAGKLGDGECEHDEMLRIGARIAPLAVGFVLSVIEDAIKCQVSTVHYFTREGLFFKQLHDAITSLDPFGLPCPSSEVLHVSRLATFAASLKAVSPEQLMNIWRLYSSQSINDLAISLNLDTETVGTMARNAGLDPGETIRYPWTDETFLRFLASSEFQAFAVDGINRQRQMLLGYLAESAVTDNKVAMVVDIGWRGTIHDNLARLMPQKHWIGRYLGLFSMLNPQAPNTEKEGWIFDEARGRSAQIEDVAPLEMIFNGSGGSVIGYEADENGSISSRRHVVPGEEEIVRGPVAQLQAGILSAVPDLIAYVRLHGLTSAEMHGLASAICTELSRNPPTAIADVFQRLQHNEMFGRGLVDDVSSNSTLIAALDQATGSALHAAASEALAKERWPAGALRASRFAAWFAQADQRQRSSVPLALSKVHAPAIVKAVGSRLNVYVPAPIRASGGHRTIFNVVGKLAELGLELEIFVENEGDGLPIIEEYLGRSKAVIHSAWHGYIPSQIAFATVAHSAKYVSELTNTHYGCYLVQDFEALFNPMSDGYIRAENSYAHGLQHFTIGNWLTHLIRTNYGARSIPAGLGVNTEIYRPITTLEGVRLPRLVAAEIDEIRLPSVCFLYQPDKPRRLPEIGIEALKMVKREMPDCSIYVYGSDLPLALDFEVHNLGLINKLDDLNDLYNRCKIGLCISGSNPSRIPYEMMAAGCVPVDLYRYNNLLDHETGAARLAFQNSDSLAQAMLSLLNDNVDWSQSSKKGQSFASSRSLDWETDVIANSILAMLDGRLANDSPLDLLYSADPIIAATGGNLKSIENFCAAQFAMARNGSSTAE